MQSSFQRGGNEDLKRKNYALSTAVNSPISSKFHPYSSFKGKNGLSSARQIDTKFAAENISERNQLLGNSRIRKYSTCTMNSDLLVLNSDLGDMRGKSQAPTALDDGTLQDTEDHQNYQRKSIVKKDIQEVKHIVPYPAQCPECEYQGFTEVETRDTRCSKALSIPVFIGFFACWIFGSCQSQRQSCLDDCREADHRCFNCKSVIATKNSIMKKKPKKIQGISYTQSSQYSSECSNNTDNDHYGDDYKSNETVYFEVAEDEHQLDNVAQNQDLHQRRSTMSTTPSARISTKQVNQRRQSNSSLTSSKEYRKIMEEYQNEKNKQKYEPQQDFFDEQEEDEYESD
eukprot:403365899